MREQNDMFNTTKTIMSYVGQQQQQLQRKMSKYWSFLDASFSHEKWISHSGHFLVFFFFTVDWSKITKQNSCFFSNSLTWKIRGMSSLLRPFLIVHRNGHKLTTQRFLGSCSRTSVTYDWLMVALNTIDQSELTLVRPNGPKNHFTQNLYPFSLDFVK